MTENDHTNSESRNDQRVTEAAAGSTDTASDLAIVRGARTANERSSRGAAVRDRQRPRQRGRDRSNPGNVPELTPDPTDPRWLAEQCLSREWQYDHRPTLVFWGDAMYTWKRGAAYIKLGKSQFEAQVTNAVQDKIDELSELGIGARSGKPFPVTRRLVADVCAHLKAMTLVPTGAEPPVWLDQDDNATRPDPQRVMVMQNGLLEIPITGDAAPTLHPDTPAFFSLNAVDYAFDAHAECPRWLRFLDEVWPDDEQSIALLRQWFGYVLTSDTSQQRIMLMHGPPRSGRGTTSRVLESLVGSANVVSPALSSLAEPFALQSWIDKTLAVIPDARLGGRSDQQRLLERLLSISGEDRIAINRKFAPIINMMLRTRIMLVTNELPVLRDASQAFVSRLEILRFQRSWAGRENKTLTSELLQELPGIFNWSLIGLRELHRLGHFTRPATSESLFQELQDLASPISAFISECCVVQPDATVDREWLYRAWCTWCERNGQRLRGADIFGKDLRSAVPDVERYQPREENGMRRNMYLGIGLR